MTLKLGREWREAGRSSGTADSRNTLVDAWIDEEARRLVGSEPSPEAQRAIFSTIAELREAARSRSSGTEGMSWLAVISASIAVLLLASVAIRIVVHFTSPVEARVGEALLLAVSESRLAFWINESLVGYPMFLFLHTLSLAVVVGVGVAIDLRVLGVAAQIPLASLRSLTPAIWIGFLTSTFSGIFLFSANALGKGEHPVFAIKLAVVASALLVSVLIERQLVAPTGSRASTRSKTLAVVSLLLWIAAVIAGRMVGYVAEGVYQ